LSLLVAPFRDARSIGERAPPAAVARGAANPQRAARPGARMDPARAMPDTGGASWRPGDARPASPGRDRSMAITPKAPVSVGHPLEPLGAEEVAAAVKILRQQRQLGERVRF